MSLSLQTPRLPATLPDHSSVFQKVGGIQQNATCEPSQTWLTSVSGQSSVNALPLTGPGLFTGVTVPVAFVLFQEALQLKMCAEYTTQYWHTPNIESMPACHPVWYGCSVVMILWPQKKSTTTNKCLGVSVVTLLQTDYLSVQQQWRQKNRVGLWLTVLISHEILSCDNYISISFRQISLFVCHIGHDVCMTNVCVSHLARCVHD